MPKNYWAMFSIFGHFPYICNVKQKQIIIETFLKETKITKHKQNQECHESNSSRRLYLQS